MLEKKMDEVSLRKIQINDEYWNKYIPLVEKVILPFQWELINDRVEGAEKSYCIRNFKIAGGKEEGEHRGMVFQDTDVAKWLEAVAFSLEKNPDPQLEATADEAIELIAAAQCQDGYLNTYYTIRGEKRWKDLFEGHELYTAGHMMEAAVAYYKATGKSKFLEVVCRFADNICEVFGPEDDKRHGYPGHPEIELALVKLYRVTGKREYLELAYYFITERGVKPSYFLGEECFATQKFLFPEFKDFDLDYCQAHEKLTDQRTAEGHAVRAVYLYSAMADLAYEYRNETLLAQCETLFDNIVEKRMYLTGSIGSAAYGERFTTDYDLPNDTNYSETCASIGLAMFAARMLRITADGKYADIMERALYNTLLSGVALDGKHFFYVNPLEVAPDIAEHNPSMRHVMTTRQKWFGVACCPPNITRTLASMGQYIYAVTDNTLYVHLYIGSHMECELNGKKAEITVSTQYPYRELVSIHVKPHQPGQKFTVALRSPGFSTHSLVRINGSVCEVKAEKGYYYLTEEWKEGDTIELELEMKPRFVYANAKVRNDIGKAALMMGPVVYCLEEADNGKYLSGIRADTAGEIRYSYEEELLGGTGCLHIRGSRIACGREDNAENGIRADELYTTVAPVYEQAEFKAIPYCLWNNRGKGEMTVWMHC